MTGRKYAALAVDPGTDPEWCALRAATQLVYTLVLRDPEISKVGVVDYAPMRWAQWVSDLDAAAVAVELATLESARFVVVDPVANRLLVRSYVRHDGTKRNPKHAGGVLSALKMVRSVPLRAALAVELERVDDADVASSILPEIRSWQAKYTALAPGSTANPIANPIANGLPIEQPLTINQQPTTNPASDVTTAVATTAAVAARASEGPEQSEKTTTNAATKPKGTGKGADAIRICATRLVRETPDLMTGRAQNRVSVEKIAETALRNNVSEDALRAALTLLATPESKSNAITGYWVTKAIAAVSNADGSLKPTGARTLGRVGNAPSGLLPLSEGRDDRDRFSAPEAAGF